MGRKGFLKIIPVLCFIIILLLRPVSSTRIIRFLYVGTCRFELFHGWTFGLMIMLVTFVGFEIFIES